MRYNKKRVINGLFSVATILLLAACGSDSPEGGSTNAGGTTDSSVTVAKEGFPITEEVMSMTAMAPNVAGVEWGDMPPLMAYEEMTNIQVAYNTPPRDDFATKLNLAFASNDLPDMIISATSSNLTPEMEVEYGNQGVLLPLEDLIPEYAPNFDKLLGENPDIRKSITAPDGHIYSLPTVVKTEAGIRANVSLWYNGPWMESVGVTEIPKTTDELYDLLVKFRDEDPNGNGEKDEIPLSSAGTSELHIWMLGAFGMKTRGIEEQDGTVVFTPILESYKHYLEYMNKLYSEGLLDRDLFSQSRDQHKAKGQSDKLGLFPAFHSYNLTDKPIDEAMEDPMFGPLTSEYNDTPIMSMSAGLSRATFAITNNNPSPEAALRWVDYFYSEEGALFYKQGPENSIWEYQTNEAGEQVKVYLNGMDGTMQPDYGLNSPTIRLDSLNENPVLEDANAISSSEYIEFDKQEVKEKLAPYGEVAYPLVYLTEEEQNVISSVTVDLETYVEQMEAQFITGVEPLSNWDSYVETIESMNINEYIQVYQDAYDRWAES